MESIYAFNNEFCIATLYIERASIEASIEILGIPSSIVINFLLLQIKNAT